MRRAISLLCVVLLCTAAAAGSAVAADTSSGLFDFEPQEVDAEPGETISIDIVLQVVTHGDDGQVVSLNYTVRYDPEVLTLQDVEEGPWLYTDSDQDDVTFDAEIDHEAGALAVEQTREPPAEEMSRTTTDTTATLTFAVDESAPPSNATLQFEDTHIQAVGYPLATYDGREGLILVDGGAVGQPDGDQGDDDPSGVQLAEDTPTPDDDDDTTGLTGDGFGVLGALTALALVFGVLAARR